MFLGKGTKYCGKGSEEHIDIWIEDEENIIVIENKIKSKINGIKHDIYSSESQNQLNIYYEHAQKCCKGRALNCFIFAPDYNCIDLTKYKSGQQYTVINYSSIYSFYKDNAGEMIQIPYFKEFLEALYIHSQSTDRSNFEIMHERFIERIRKIRDNLDLL